MALLKKVLLVAGLLLLVGLVAGGLWLRRSVEREAAARREGLAAQITRFEAAVAADQAVATEVGLLAPRPGRRDAGPVLNPRLDWSLGDAERVQRWRAALPAGAPSLALPPARREQITKGWLDADPALWEGLDLGWLATLDGYDLWDLERSGPSADLPARAWLDAPLPDVADLMAWSRLRLARGLRDGAPEAAAAEVRSLARLAFSSETLLGAALGVGLLGLEDEARARAAATGLASPAWKAIDQATRTRLRRAAYAAQAWVDLDTPPAQAATFDRLSIGRCAALNEKLHAALTYRPLLGRARANDYLRLGQQLQAATECRLPSLRRDWGQPDDLQAEDLCGPRPAASCRAVVAMRWVPLLGESLGETLHGLAAPDPFQRYAEGGH